MGREPQRTPLSSGKGPSQWLLLSCDGVEIRPAALHPEVGPAKQLRGGLTAVVTGPTSVLTVAGMSAVRAAIGKDGQSRGTDWGGGEAAHLLEFSPQHGGGNARFKGLLRE